MRTLIVLLSILVTGCASTKPNLVPLTMASDQGKPCVVLLRDINLTKNDVAAAHEAARVQKRKNTIYAATGVLILIPAFFMDFSGAAEKEEQAARSRVEYLTGIYNQKCGVKA